MTEKLNLGVFMYNLKRIKFINSTNPGNIWYNKSLSRVVFKLSSKLQRTSTLYVRLEYAHLLQGFVLN